MYLFTSDLLLLFVVGMLFLVCVSYAKYNVNRDRLKQLREKESAEHEDDDDVSENNGGMY